jgi:hypothetical protein
MPPAVAFTVRVWYHAASATRERTTMKRTFLLLLAGVLAAVCMASPAAWR